MKILEKILEEIDKMRDDLRDTLRDEKAKAIPNDLVVNSLEGNIVGLLSAKKIIRFHMEDDGWIPAANRLPVTNEFMCFEPTPYMCRLEIAYMTDTIEYIIGYYDGYKWMDKYHDSIKNVVAWKIHEPYHPKED